MALRLGAKFDIRIKLFFTANALSRSPPPVQPLMRLASPLSPRTQWLRSAVPALPPPAPVLAVARAAVLALPPPAPVLAVARAAVLARVLRAPVLAVALREARSQTNEPVTAPCTAPCP
jgi:hypothetical protein